MNLRNLLALEPGFESQPLGPALPRAVKPPLGKAPTFLPSGVVVNNNTGKMHTAFVRGEHYSQWPCGVPEYKISGTHTGRMSSSASTFQELPRARPDDASKPYKAPARFQRLDANAVMAAALATSGDELPGGWKPFYYKTRAGEIPKQLLMSDGRVVQWQDRALHSPKNCVAWR